MRGGKGVGVGPDAGATPPAGLLSLLGMLGGASAMLALVALLLPPVWETNDDPGMMMYAHGFGFAGVPSPLLLFSNIWQGHVVLALGWPLGFAGYSVYVMGAQVLATALAAWLLARMTGAPWMSLLVMAALSLRPMIAPQFTITAGFLCAAAILAWLEHARAPRAWLPPLGAALFFAGFLMREQIALLFGLVALPLLLQPALLRSRGMWLCLALVILGAFMARWDHARAMAGPEWQAFRELNLPRAAFTDFELMPRVAASPEAMAAAGWSQNDLMLVRHFWFVDEALASPAALTAAIGAVGGVSAMFALDAGRLAALRLEFLRWDFLGAGLLALLGLVLAPGAMRWRLLGCAVLVLAGLLAIAAFGRLHIGRVGYPLLALLAMVGMAALRPGTLRFAGAVAPVAAFFMVLELAPRAGASAQGLPAAKAFLRGLDPAQVHVIWGASLPIEALYAPLMRRGDMPSVALFGLGTHQLSPSALARFDGDVGRVVTQLRGPAGLNMILFDAYVPLLRTYCAERWQGELITEWTADLGSIRAGRVRCQSAGPAGG